jgi:hypothetical protein
MSAGHRCTGCGKLISTGAAAFGFSSPSICTCSNPMLDSEPKKLSAPAAQAGLDPDGEIMQLAAAARRLADEVERLSRIAASALAVCDKQSGEYERMKAELAEYRRWHAGGRANIEFHGKDDARVRICRGLHGVDAPCSFIEYFKSPS